MWPPNSPYLNPVDYVIWSVSQQRVLRAELKISMSCECDSVYCMCGAAWSSSWLMIQLTNGQHDCVQIQFIELVARRLKDQKAKQTIMHCTTKQYNTRNEMKRNAMQWKQNAQLSQRDRAAGYISFGRKWKTGTQRQYFTDIVSLASTTVT